MHNASQGRPTILSSPILSYLYESVIFMRNLYTMLIRVTSMNCHVVASVCPISPSLTATYSMIVGSFT
jgi:hypothetical protein